MFDSKDEVMKFPTSNAPVWQTPVFKGVHAERRCRQLGIPGTQPIRRSLISGASGYRAASGRPYPATYAGERMWGETFADLARLLAPYGWSDLRLNGVDVLVCADSNIAIIVTAGTAGVGNISHSPQVRYSRKTAVKELVNEKPPTLFGNASTERSEVWFLLHHVSDYTLDAELSRPVLVGGSGLVSGWAERIIIEVERGRPSVGSKESEPVDPVIDIRVERRAR